MKQEMGFARLYDAKCLPVADEILASKLTNLNKKCINATLA